MRWLMKSPRYLDALISAGWVTFKTRWVVCRHLRHGNGQFLQYYRNLMNELVRQMQGRFVHTLHDHALHGGSSKPGRSLIDRSEWLHQLLLQAGKSILCRVVRSLMVRLEAGSPSTLSCKIRSDGATARSYSPIPVIMRTPPSSQIHVEVRISFSPTR